MGDRLKFRAGALARLASIGVVGLSVAACAHGGQGITSTREPPRGYFAPIYTDGPVPLPGEDFTLPTVTGANGKPIPVPSLPPGMWLAFPEPERAPPTSITITKHREPEDPPDADVGAISLPVDAVPQPDGKSFVIAFTLPDLPLGTYDAWYTGGRAPGKASAFLHAPAKGATQRMSFEVRPQLEAVASVVRADVGKTTVLEVKTGSTGTSRPGVKVTLSGFMDGVKLAAGQSATEVADEAGIARFRVRFDKLTDSYLAATAEGYAPVAIRVVGGPLQPLKDARLKPGDVLMCQGRSLISGGIVLAERAQLGSPNPRGRPWYSHAALYLGEGRTAEMLMLGLFVHDLSDTLGGCTTLDVYRLDGITPDAASKVADVARYGKVPYAYGQIAALFFLSALSGDERVKPRRPRGLFGWIAALLELPGQILRAGAQTAAILAYAPSRGPGAMICSELVHTSYFDNELSIGVAKWWPSAVATGLVRDSASKLDFTTPNMLSQSEGLSFRFQLYPPVPSVVEFDGCSLRLDEPIEFVSGSAELEPSDDDLLRAVLAAIKPTTYTLREVGHTDDVGSAEDNLALSQARAEATATWLTNNGLPADRIKTEGLGESTPRVPNSSAANRYRNRRVEFHLDAGDCTASQP